jgi:hypothetical protein
MTYSFPSEHINPRDGNPPSSSPSSPLPAALSQPPSPSAPPTLSPAQSQQSDLKHIVESLRWWFNPALSDPQLPDMKIVLASVVRHKKDKMHFAAFGNIAGAAQWAVKVSMHSNIYFHVALHGDCPNGKGTIETALCLPGVVADLDAQSPFRGENEGKAPSIEALHLLIGDFEHHYPFPLTLVESGYGIYPYLRFREPLFLVDQRTRDEAGELLTRFAEAFRIFGHRRGWSNTVDRVTLAGLMRLPGTFNRKGPSPLPVRLVDRSGGVP